LLLEGAARVFVSASQADEGAEVAVEFGGGEEGVSGGVEGIYVCGRRSRFSLRSSLIEYTSKTR
jgi:hypothetical protein